MLNHSLGVIVNMYYFNFNSTIVQTLGRASQSHSFNVSFEAKGDHFG